MEIFRSPSWPNLSVMQRIKLSEDGPMQVEQTQIRLPSPILIASVCLLSVCTIMVGLCWCVRLCLCVCVCVFVIECLVSVRLCGCVYVSAGNDFVTCQAAAMLTDNRGTHVFWPVESQLHQTQSEPAAAAAWGRLVPVIAAATEDTEFADWSRVLCF